MTSDDNWPAPKPLTPEEVADVNEKARRLGESAGQYLGRLMAESLIRQRKPLCPRLPSA